MKAAFVPRCVVLTCNNPSLPGDIHCRKCDEYQRRTRGCCLKCDQRIPKGYSVAGDCPHCGSEECGLPYLEARLGSLMANVERLAA